MKFFDRSMLWKAGLTVAALALLIHQLDIEPLVASAGGAYGGWMLLALSLLPLNLLLEAMGWHLLVRHEIPDTRFGVSCTSVLLGHTLGCATPARLGELAGRSLPLDHPRPGRLMALVVTDRLAAMAVGIIVGLAAFLLFLFTVAPRAVPVGGAVACYGALVSGLLLSLLLRPEPTLRFLRTALPFAWLHRPLRSVRTLRTRRMARVIGVGLLRYAVYVTQFVLLLRAFAPFADPRLAFLGVAVVFFVKFLAPPIFLFDLGLREGAAVVILGYLGVPEAAAFNAALLLFGINLVLPALLGLPLVPRLYKRPASATRPHRSPSVSTPDIP